jgi:hypothetical protein
VTDAPGERPDGPTPPAVEGAATPSTQDAGTTTVAYEIVYDCRDRMVGSRLAQRLQDVLGPTYRVDRTEEAASWSVTVRFPSQASADRFFDSDFYRQFCIEVRRSCRSPVLVVPLGPVEA